MNEDIRRKILQILSEDPEISQRELAERLGVSLGKTNYCIQSVIQKGWVKVNNFRNSSQKSAYSYILTPGGLEQKARLTVDYIKRKVSEYEAIKQELKEVTGEIEEDDSIWQELEELGLSRYRSF